MVRLTAIAERLKGPANGFGWAYQRYKLAT
jgi:hypothetical protein